MGYVFSSKIWIIGLLMVTGVSTASADNDRELSENDILRRLMRNYDKSQSPTGDEDKAVEVKVSLYVQSVQIDELQKTAKVVAYFRQTWTDKRLQFNDTRTILASNSDIFWKPDTFFVTQASPATSDHELFKIFPSGSVWYAKRMYIVITPEIFLRRFPSVDFSVPLVIESFAGKADRIVITSLPNSVEITQRLQLEYMLYDTLTEDCTTNFTSGSYSCLKITLMLKRPIGDFLLGIGLPSVLAIVMSWCSLWLPLSSISLIKPRIQIHLVAILLSVLIVHWNRTSHVTYSMLFVTSSDILTTGSLLVVLASFIESVIVILLTSHNAAGNKDESHSFSLKKRKADFIAIIAVPVAFAVVIIATIYF